MNDDSSDDDDDDDTMLTERTVGWDRMNAPPTEGECRHIVTSKHIHIDAYTQLKQNTRSRPAWPPTVTALNNALVFLSKKGCKCNACHASAVICLLLRSHSSLHPSILLCSMCPWLASRPHTNKVNKWLPHQQK